MKWDNFYYFSNISISIFTITSNTFFILTKLWNSFDGFGLVIVNFLFAMILRNILYLANTHLKHLLDYEINTICLHQEFFNGFTAFYISTSLAILMIVSKFEPEKSLKAALKWIAISLVSCFFYGLLYFKFSTYEITINQNGECKWSNTNKNFRASIIIRDIFKYFIPSLILIFSLFVIRNKRVAEENQFVRYAKICSHFYIGINILTIITELSYIFIDGSSFEFVSIMFFILFIFYYLTIFHPFLYCIHDKDFYETFKRIFCRKENNYVIYKNHDENS